MIVRLLNWERIIIPATMAKLTTTDSDKVIIKGHLYVCVCLRPDDNLTDVHLTQIMALLFISVPPPFLNERTYYFFTGSEVPSLTL